VGGQPLGVVLTPTLPASTHGRRAALMIGGSSQFMGAPRLGVYGLPRALVGCRIGSNMASNMP
jgi:hypothetical protein